MEGKVSVSTKESLNCLRRLRGLQSTIREVSSELPAGTRRGLNIDDFCRLPVVENVDSRIEAAERLLLAIEETESIREMHEFELIALPQVDVDGIRDTLKATIAELEQSAIDILKLHFTSLGKESERWMSKGMEFLEQNDGECPFCGQGVDASDLVAHYQHYFSSEYAEHKARISHHSQSIEKLLGGDSLARFQREWQRHADAVSFWGNSFQLSK